MEHWLLVASGLAALVVGLGSLALTLYVRFGDWPAGVFELVEYRRSLAVTENAPPEPLIGNAHGRTRLDLGGTWQALVDPDRSPPANLLGRIPRGVPPDGPSDLVEFSFENGLELRVPGDWNTQDERLFFYRGPVWYRRSFRHQRRPGRRTFLYFGAANYRAEVYLNGRRVGTHTGGFTPFNFEVTGSLRDGENLLVVLVDNESGPEDIPARVTDWLNYGGLTREVFLIELPEVFIRNYRVQLARGSRERIRGWVQLDGAHSPREVRLAIPELGVSAALTTDASGRAELDLAATPELWSPQSPRLYRVEIRAGADELVDAIGFRTIEVRGSEILLNGEPIFLRGISIHEEAPHGGGRAHSAEHAALLLDWARELEANFVRLAHYPHNEEMLRAADRMGLLVWAEIPVYWEIAFDEPRTLALGKAQLSEIIARDFNRASLIFWSIGNETPVNDDRNAFMQALADHVRGEDPTRLVTGAILTGERAVTPVLRGEVVPALLGFGSDQWVMKVDDPLGRIVDVPALNQYFGWYYSSPLAQFTPFSSASVRRTIVDNLERLRFDTGLDKPLIISEFGAGAKRGFHAPEEELAVFSEEYQALVYRRQLAMLERQSQVRGLSPWILKDFRSPLRLYQGVQDYWNLKGLVSDDGHRKQAFGVLRDHYLERRRRSRRD